jgi:DNA-binding CsgD family transcriptional regulator
VTPHPLGAAGLEEARHLFALLRTASCTTTDEPARSRFDELAERLADTLRGPVVTTTARLTAREVDVLAHAALGRRNSEIAQHLAISSETVKSYLRSAMTKLDAHSRHGAVESARRARAIP